MQNTKTALYSIFLLAIALISCSRGSSGNQEAASNGEPNNELSRFELDHGIGPITEKMELSDELDVEKARRGFNIFEMSCMSCHALNSRIIGPPLGDVIERRSPEFVMNYLLNSEENSQRHPIGQKLLEQYRMQMPNPNLSENEAREILEYIRYAKATGEQVL